MSAPMALVVVAVLAGVAILIWKKLADDRRRDLDTVAYRIRDRNLAGQAPWVTSIRRVGERVVIHGTEGAPRWTGGDPGSWLEAVAAAGDGRGRRIRVQVRRIEGAGQMYEIALHSG